MSGQAVPDGIPGGNPDGTPGTLPSGSGAASSSYPVALSLLELLSANAFAGVLASSTIGLATASRIASTLELVETFRALNAYRIDASSLNALPSSSASTTLSANSVSASSKTTIIVWLGNVTPTAQNPFLRLSNGTIYFDIPSPQGGNVKRFEFRALPASVAASFWLVNGLGVPLASSGNVIVSVGV